MTIARQLVFSRYQFELYERLQVSHRRDPRGVAGKAVKEVAYHRDHATQWMLRLGDGTDESHRRMQAGLDRVWPYVDELFGATTSSSAWSPTGIAVDCVRRCATAWDGYVAAVLAEADADRPDATSVARGVAGAGIHTEAMGFLLAEMQHLHRCAPGGVVVSAVTRRRLTRGRRGVGRARPGGAGADHRRPRGAARRRVDADGRVEVVDHADLLRLPGHGRDPATTSSRRCAPRLRRRSTVRDGAVAGLDDRLDDRRRQGASCRSTASRRRPADALAAAGRAVAVGALPAVRLARHPRAQPVRLDRVQVAVGVQRLPGAVRPLQGASEMTAVADDRRAPAPTRSFHPLRVGAIEPLTDDAVAITFEVPDELRRRRTTSPPGST